MPFAEMLGQVSPWWWVAAAIILAAAEMLTFTTYLIWPALSALLMAVAVWLVPDLSPAIQLGVFSVLCVVITFIGRAVFSSARTDDAASALNNRAEQLTGRTGQAESFANGEGKVIIDGIPWPARTQAGPDPATGEQITVVSTDGIVVMVRATKSQAH